MSHNLASTFLEFLQQLTKKMDFGEKTFVFNNVSIEYS